MEDLLKDAEGRTKSAWEAHAALKTVVGNHWSRSRTNNVRSYYINV